MALQGVLPHVLILNSCYGTAVEAWIRRAALWTDATSSRFLPLFLPSWEACRFYVVVKAALRTGLFDIIYFVAK